MQKAWRKPCRVGIRAQIEIKSDLAGGLASDQHVFASVAIPIGHAGDGVSFGCEWCGAGVDEWPRPELPLLPLAGARRFARQVEAIKGADVNLRRIVARANRQRQNIS
jgi:hypothetical protein